MKAHRSPVALVTALVTVLAVLPASSGCQAEEPAPAGFPEDPLEKDLEQHYGAPFAASRSPSGRVEFALPLSPTRSVASSDEGTAAALVDLLAVHGAAMGISRALDRTGPPRVEPGLDGMRTVHVEQHLLGSGVPVLGKGARMTLDAEGRIVHVASSVDDAFDAVGPSPRLSPEEAKRAVLARVGEHVAPPPTEAELAHEPALVATTDPSGAPALAYVALLRPTDDRPASWIATVSAEDGSLFSIAGGELRLDAERVDALSIGNYLPFPEGYRGLTLPIDVATRLKGTPDEMSYLLRERTGASSEVRTLADDGPGELPGLRRTREVGSRSKSEWDDRRISGVLLPGPGAGVDAHYNASFMDAFFRRYANRPPLDGPIVSIVHRPDLPEDASYDPYADVMKYGDGGSLTFPTSIALDVVGHELTHGYVIRALLAGAARTPQRIASLLQPIQVGEAGGLNEAVSDAIGMSAKLARYPSRRRDVIGEVLLRSHTGVRSMVHPSSRKTPGGDRVKDHTSRSLTRDVRMLGGMRRVLCESIPLPTNDWGCVHANAGIGDNAWYLMSFGGINDRSRVRVSRGLGWEGAIRLWLDAVPSIGPTTPYRTFALAQVAFARSRAIDVSAVACAWVAVGVLTNADAARYGGVTCQTGGRIDCAGLADGWYCEENEPTPAGAEPVYAGTLCAGGKRAPRGHLQCPTGFACARVSDQTGDRLNNRATMSETTGMFVCKDLLE